ncbi:MAG: NUDIX hydrolase [Clostridiales bacterium GWF2_38_85]|nr:MAG: NUDIX hydrolase [Clostridiales bacterium GWF2_38_85]HBL84420.1 NUDIX hydrolase [Clostridiales bacterium]
MEDYITEMRKLIGHTPLLSIGCDVIIENNGQILLQKRTDDGEWCVPGGGMNFGETFLETATREVMEETGLKLESLSLFGIYSGKNCVVEYPNKDVVFGGIVVFIAKKYSGELRKNSNESYELKFFSRENLPQNIRKTNKIWINQWKKGQDSIFIG